MEKILIRSCVLNYSAKHIEVEMAMYNEKGDKLKALLRTVFIPFDVRSGSVYEHESDILDLLKEIRVEEISGNTEERLVQLEDGLVRA
jgi:acyl-CoA thioesterase FadM